MKKNNVLLKKTGIVLIVIAAVIVFDLLMLYAAGVFEWYGIKKTYQKALNEGSTVMIYKDGDDITTVINENNENAEEIDISNKELDEYIESISDEERRDLMKDYFFLPSVPQYTIQEISGLPAMERAKYLAEMPIDDLRAAVKVIQDNIDNSIRIQNEEQGK